MWLTLYRTSGDFGSPGTVLYRRRDSVMAVFTIRWALCTDNLLYFNSYALTATVRLTYLRHVRGPFWQIQKK